MNKKKDGIELKLNGWMTQKSYASKYNLRQVLVAQWVCRAKQSKNKESNHIQYLDVPDLGLTLVKEKVK